MNVFMTVNIELRPIISVAGLVSGQSLRHLTPVSQNFRCTWQPILAFLTHFRRTHAYALRCCGSI